MRCSVFVILIFTACGDSRHGQRATTNDAVAFDTLVTAESGILGSVSDIAVGFDGRVWLTDRINNSVVLIDPAIGTLDVIGRKGEGPGEFSGPEALALTDIGVLVFELRNRRLQQLGPGGEFIHSEPVEAGAFRPVALNELGDVAFPTLGRDSSLALVIRSSGARHRIGVPTAPTPRMMQVARVREQALQGEIPIEFANNVLPILDSTGRSFLIVQSTGDVMAFDTAGLQQWMVHLPETVVAAARSSFFAKYQGDSTAMGIHVPEIVRGGTVVDDVLWLSLPHTASGGSAIVALDADTGDLFRRIDLPMRGTGVIAVDDERRRLYVTIPEEAILLAVDY